MNETRLNGFAPIRTVTGLLALLLLAACAVAPPPPPRPNVIVIFTDDHGWADLGVHGVRDDISTPNVDRLAASGVRFTSGYVTAPQCNPSRAGLLTGRYQQRFGMEDGDTIPLPLDEVLLPQRLAAAGYVTGMVGKWHLEPSISMESWMAENLPAQSALPVSERDHDAITFEMQKPYMPNARGFDETWYGSMNEYLVNYDLSGRDVSWRLIPDRRNRIRVQADAATAFIERHTSEPFFLYLAFFAPHVPLQAEDEWLERFPGEMPERRRYALAMMSAVDDGVGRIMDTLERHGLTGNTLVFFISDNGAPTEMGAVNEWPVGRGGPFWNGSLNDPLVGEKGMLTEGGIRVPFVMSWPGTLPAGAVYDKPVSTLDVAPTVLAQAGIGVTPELDGVDLMPYLTGERTDAPHEDLYWRFYGQAAIRSGDWKYLRLAGEREFLFQLPPDGVESRNLIGEHPEKAAELKAKLEAWADDLSPPGLPDTLNRRIESVRYRHYLPAD